MSSKNYVPITSGLSNVAHYSLESHSVNQIHDQHMFRHLTLATPLVCYEALDSIMRTNDRCRYGYG